MDEGKGGREKEMMPRQTSKLYFEQIEQRQYFSKIKAVKVRLSVPSPQSKYSMYLVTFKCVW